MAGHEERRYRKRTRARGLVSFQLAVKETDLWVSAGRELARETLDLVLQARHQVESYIQGHPQFLTTLSAYPRDSLAPPLVREMIAQSADLAVGPMAAVAGAVAEYVGRGLLAHTAEVIVENGGDIFLYARRDVTAAVFAEDSPFGGKLGLRVSAGAMPAGLCSSSARIGHSLSLGGADLVCVLSPSAARADAAATAVANRVRSKRDLEKAASWARLQPALTGGLIMLGNQMATWGEVELVPLQKGDVH